MRRPNSGPECAIHWLDNSKPFIEIARRSATSGVDDTGTPAPDDEGSINGSDYDYVEDIGTAAAVSLSIFNIQFTQAASAADTDSVVLTYPLIMTSGGDQSFFLGAYDIVDPFLVVYN